MKHLIAIDEIEAVYWDDGRPDRPFDAYEYIDKFISIRTAANLIEFLHAYPGGLIEFHPWIERESPHKLTEGGKYPWFSAKRMNSAMETLNKKMGLGIDWIDSLNDELPNHIGMNREIDRLKSQTFVLANAINAVYAAPKTERKALASELIATIDATQLVDGVDEYSTFLTSLYIAHISLRELLKVAAVANGRGEPQFPITRVDAGAESWSEIGADFDPGPVRRLNVFVPLPAATLLVHFMDKTHAICSLESFSVEHDYLHFDHCGVVGDSIVFEDSYLSFDKVSTLPKHWTNENIARFLTSWALTEWLREYTSRQCVGFDERGFYKSNIDTNEIVDAIFDCISNDRVGICERCGEPFIAGRKESDGSFSRHYCTKTCRNTALKERSNNG